MGSDNRAVPALGRAVKLTPTQLAAAMSAKARALGLKNTRFHDPTGLSSENVSTPRETIAMLKAVMNHPVLGPITHRLEYDAHPVGKPPITYNNTYKPAVRSNIQVLGGKTGYNDDARYCLVIATKIDGHNYFMAFLSNEGKLTRFGDVARVADWVLVRKPGKSPAAPATAAPAGTALAAAPGKRPATAMGQAAHATTTATETASASSSAAAGGASATAATTNASTTPPATTAPPRVGAEPAPSTASPVPPAAADNTGASPNPRPTDDDPTKGPALPIGIAAPPPPATEDTAAH